MVGHLQNPNTKVKMAKVDGCTFFRREDGSWRHVDSSCKNPEHSVWIAELKIGECTLVRKDGKWAHSGDLCAKAKKWQAAQEQFVSALENLNAIDGSASELAKTDAENVVVGAFYLVDAMSKPACALESDDVPKEVAGAKFVCVGDVFHHLGYPRRQSIYAESFSSGEQIRMTRAPGWKVNEFSEKVNKTLANIAFPSNAHKHILVEV